MIGALIVVFVVVVVLPMTFVMGGGVVAAIFGSLMTATKEADNEGNELVDLNT